MKDAPKVLSQASVAIIDGMVFCGGSRYSIHGVLQYNPDSGEWSELPKAPVREFSVTSLNGQLVLAGGGDISGDDVNTITVWDRGRSEWVHPYPPMPTERSLSAAVGYQNYLIVACGWYERDIVEVLDSSSGRWYKAQSVPMRGHAMTSVVIGDCWYLSSFRGWKDGKTHIFQVNLPTLISTATSVHTIWEELPTPPVGEPTLLALQGHLLLIGGIGHVQELHHYDRETKQWRKCGQLPVGMAAPCCAVLPSGELMVTGFVAKDLSYSCRMWIGSVE